MSTMAMNPGAAWRMPVLAWDVATEDEARFRRIRRAVLAICVLLCIGVLLAPAVNEDRSQPTELPPRLAKMILERKPTPPPPPAPKPERLDANKAIEKDAPVATAKPVPVRPPEPNKAVPVPEARQPVPGKPPGEVDAARRKVAGIGLLQSSNELAQIAGAPVAVQLRTDIKQGPGVGTSTGVGVGAGTEPGVPTRSLLTSNATGGSGGINTAGYSRDTGGGGLAGRATTLVEGAAGGGGGGGAGGGGALNGKAGGTGAGSGKSLNPGGAVARGNSGKASRSLEEIRIVFDRNKGSIYAIYNRALREDPGLQGKVVLKLTIAPSGAVVDCRIESSELKSPELENKLLARVRQFDFGARDVDQMIVTYPVDFLPS